MPEEDFGFANGFKNKWRNDSGFFHHGFESNEKRDS